MLHCPELKSPAHPDNRCHLDIQLAMHLERQLQSKMHRSIRVHIGSHEMQLFGSVASWHEKQLAQETARSIAPMYHIRNELRVQPFDCSINVIST